MSETTHFEYVVQTARHFSDSDNILNGRAEAIVRVLTQGTGGRFPEYETLGETNSARTRFVCEALNDEVTASMRNSQIAHLVHNLDMFKVARAAYVQAARAFMLEMAVVGYDLLAQVSVPDSVSGLSVRPVPSIASLTGMQAVSQMMKDFALDSDGRCVIGVPENLQALFGLQVSVRQEGRRAVLMSIDWMQSDDTVNYPSFAVVSSVERSVGAVFPPGVVALVGPSAQPV